MGDMAQEWMARAARLAEATLPFVPARLSTAFAEGRVSALVASPSPRSIEAALLIVDVSGFTALSEEARRRLGSEGVERFSLALSAFFAVMMELVARHAGDVDCFAGDAVVVVFEPRRKGDGGEDEGGLGEAARRALECATTVHDQLDGFKHEPQDPALRMHSALAAGKTSHPPSCYLVPHAVNVFPTVGSPSMCADLRAYAHFWLRSPSLLHQIRPPSSRIIHHPLLLT
jgi:class 3 adenylate cyclase